MPDMSMLDRRSFLFASVSLTAANWLPAFQASPTLLVLDRRFATAGAVLHSDVAIIDGDVTALWRDRLNTLWRTGTVSVAGVTQPAALFCLEQLARGMGHTVSMRLPVAGTSAVRWIISPVSPRGHI